MDASILQVLLFWLFFTVFRCMVSLLVRYVDVRIGKRWVLWIVKNMLFLIGLICFGSGMFFVFKNPICSIPFIVIFILISVALIKKK